MNQTTSTELVELLSATLMGKTEQILNAQKRLEALHHDKAFLANLITVSKDKFLPYNIRKAAVVYSLVYVKAIINLEKASENQIIENCKFLFSQLAQPVLEISLKRHLISAICFLAPFDRSIRLKCQLYQQCLNQPQFQNPNNTTMERIIFIGLALQSILSISVHITKELTEFIRKSFLPFAQIQHNLLILANSALQSQKRESILEIYQILKIYACVFKKYYKKISYSDIQTMKLLFSLQACEALSCIWLYNLPNNNLTTSIIYFARNQDNQIVQSHHWVKAEYMQSLSILLKTIHQYFKANQKEHPVLSNCELIPMLTQAIHQVSVVVGFKKIQSHSLIKLIEEIMNCLILALKTDNYIEIFKQQRESLVKGALFKILEVEGPETYEKFVDDPSELINQILQIIDMDPTQWLKQRRNQNTFIEQSEQIQQHTTLKTVAATLLSQFCLRIQNTLSQLLAYIFEYLNFEERKQISKGTMLLIVAILRDQIILRRTDTQRLLFSLRDKLQSPIPKAIIDLGSCPLEQKQNNILYLMALITVSKYLQRQKNVNPQIVNLLHRIVCDLIGSSENSQNIEQGLKILAYDLIPVIVKHSNEPNMCSNFIKIINESVVSPYNPNTCRQLDVLYNLYKLQEQEQSTQNYFVIMETLEKLGIAIEKQVHKSKSGQKIIIQKSWNIITDISANEVLAKCSQIKMKIENILLKLSQYICSGNANQPNLVQYEDHLLTCLNCLIEIDKTVTLPEMQIFSVVPFLFNQKYHKKFEQTFETLMLLLRYGGDILSNDIETLKGIIQMSFIAIQNKKTGLDEQIQKCKGALILQTVLVTYGANLPSQVYQTLYPQLLKLTQQLKPESNKLLHPNLIACLALVLAAAYNYLSQDDNDILLNSIIINKNELVLPQTSKICVISLSQLLPKVDQSFIVNRLTAIIETILFIVQKSKDYENDCEPEYEDILQKSKNKINEINEIDFFKQKIQELKKMDVNILKNVVRELPDNVVSQLKKCMSTINVNNQSRPLFKIKRNF